jgi:hypothetical protein
LTGRDAVLLAGTFKAVGACTSYVLSLDRVFRLPARNEFSSDLGLAGVVGREHAGDESSLGGVEVEGWRGNVAELDAVLLGQFDEILVFRAADE